MLKRISSALCQLSIPDKGKRLTSKGLNAEIYGQAVDAPGFAKSLQRTIATHVVMPRLPDMINAQANKAASDGDNKAFMSMLQLLSMLDDGDNETQVRAMMAMDDETYSANLRKLRDDIDKELATHTQGTTLQPGPESVKAAKQHMSELRQDESDESHVHHTLLIEPGDG